MKSSCTHLAPLMSGIKSSAFDLFSLSLSETFNLSPPGRDWYIKVQILHWPQLPSTTWPGRSSHLHLLLHFHLVKYQLLRLFTPSEPNSTTSSSSSFCYSASLCSSSIPSSPTCSGCWPDHLSPLWAQRPPLPHPLLKKTTEVKPSSELNLLEDQTAIFVSSLTQNIFLPMINISSLEDHFYNLYNSFDVQVQ